MCPAFKWLPSLLLFRSLSLFLPYPFSLNLLHLYFPVPFPPCFNPLSWLPSQENSLMSYLASYQAGNNLAANFCQTYSLNSSVVLLSILNYSDDPNTKKNQVFYESCHLVKLCFQMPSEYQNKQDRFTTCFKTCGTGSLFHMGNW